MHCQIVSQFFEFVSTGNKISFAVDFNHGSNAPTGMDIGLNHSLGSRTFCILLCLKEAFLFQNLERLFHIPFCFKESISTIRPAFKATGTVTAGNSSQTSDAAAGVVLMSKEKAKELGLKPMATFRYLVVEGCPPEYMGVGPSVAIPKVLKIAGMTLDQMQLIELNEAFAA